MFPGPFRGGGGGYRRGRFSGDTYAALLIVQLLRQISQLEYKPPVTLAAMAAMAGLYYGHIPLLDVRTVCFLPTAMIARGLFSSQTLRRLFWSSFLHANDVHLLYNMGSFLIHGAMLERSHGSPGYAAMLVALTLLAHASEFAITLAAANIFGYTAWLHECGIGFSGVIFALKVVLTADATTDSNFYGFSIPTRLLAWAELFLISMLNPNASFVGHLGGIVAGLIWVALARAGVIRAITRALTARLAAPAPFRAPAPHAYDDSYDGGQPPRPSQQRFYGGGPLGGGGGGTGLQSPDSPSGNRGNNNPGDLRRRHAFNDTAREERERERRAQRDADLARALQAEEDAALRKEEL